MNRRGSRRLEPLEHRRMLSAAGLDIVLHLGPGLQGNAAAAAAYERAAEFWEGVFADPITVNIDAEFTGGFGGGAAGTATTQTFGFAYHDVRARLVADAADDEGIVSLLPNATGQLTFNTAAGVTVPTVATGNPEFVISRANAMALGFRDLPGNTSAYTPGVTIDASITFNNALTWDFDRSDGISPGLVDFEATALHEIGHSLGFSSSVDRVDAGQTGNIRPTVLDLFRLAPGQGGAFSTAPRVLNKGSAVPVQVFHDGQFNVAPFTGTIAGLGTGDIPMSTGVVAGDGYQAGHFKESSLTGVFIGIMDPVLNVTANPSPTDLRVLGLIGWDRIDMTGYGTPPTVTVNSLTTSDNTPPLAGTVNETTTDVFVRLPNVFGTNSITLTVDGNPSTSNAFTLTNAAGSASRIASIELVLPKVGSTLGNPPSVFTPFFNTEGSGSQDFLAVAAQATAVGLLTPQSDASNDSDVRDNSKTVTLTFNNFDPGESLSWRLGMGLNTILGDDLIGGFVKVAFENGQTASGELVAIPGNNDASTVTLAVDHALRATNNGNGTWTLADNSFAALADGTYEVLVTAVDASGAISVDATASELIVNTMPPVAEAGGPYTGGEASAIVLTGGGTGTITLYEWDLDNNGSYETPGQMVNFSRNDQGIFTVGLQVTGPTGSSTDTATVTVENVAPTATAGGAIVSRINVSQTFNFSATDPSPIDQAAGFTFSIDWDGNGTFDETSGGGLTSVQLSHSFATAGSYHVTVKATDKDSGVSALASHTIHVWSSAQFGENVEWRGSDGDDVVEFQQTGAGSVQMRTLQIGGVAMNIVENYSGVTGRVLAFGNGGYDRLDASTLTNIPTTIEGGRHGDTILGGAVDDLLRGEFAGVSGDGAEGNDSITGGNGNDWIEGDGAEGGEDTLRGGAGNDTIQGDGNDGAEGRADSIFGDDGNDQLFGHHGNDFIDGGNDNDLITGGDGAEAQDTLAGGAGNDILSGSAGNDSLTAGMGLDLLLGGGGLDSLRGEAGEDLLVADHTSFDLNSAALLALHAEWTSANSYADRVAHLTGTAGGANGTMFLIPGTTVFDDESIDNLTGGATDLDWYIYNLLEDALNDHAAGETQTDTDGFLPPT